MFGGLADKGDKSQTTMIRISPIEGLNLWITAIRRQIKYYKIRLRRESDWRELSRTPASGLGASTFYAWRGRLGAESESTIEDWRRARPPYC